MFWKGNAFYRLWVRKASPDWCIRLTPLLSSTYYLFFLSGTYPGGCTHSQKNNNKKIRELQFYRGMNLWSLLVFVFKALGKNLFRFFFFIISEEQGFFVFGGCTQSIPRMWTFNTQKETVKEAICQSFFMWSFCHGRSVEAGPGCGFLDKRCILTMKKIKVKVSQEGN